MRTLTRSFLLLLAMAAAGREARAQSLSADFAQALEQAAPGERLEAYLVMSSQLSLAEMEAGLGQASPRSRRPVVVERLKVHATASQEEARALLAVAESEGRARVLEILWIANAIHLEAQPDVLRALAALPGIDRIRPVVDRGDAAEQDAPAGLVVPASALPFVEDFEGGVLGPAWTVATTGKGQVKVTSDYGPFAGNYHVTMDSKVNLNDSTASITVVLDLSRQSDILLRFYQKEFEDETQLLDGVFVSEDGVEFVRVLPLQGQGQSYHLEYLDLDEAVAGLGLAFTSAFHVRFQWFDNSPIPTDGFAFDDIYIGPEPVIVPVPEPHVVALQAPQLWEAGFDGAGVLIGSVDSGVDVTHPDLADRMWVNPGEIPGNGKDDDGNGRVDDVNGWNFTNRSGDLDSSNPHGTHCVGLAVGSGAKGRITGVATGAKLAGTAMANEAQFWAAQQYLLEIGVDVLTASFSYKWPNAPDYDVHRQIATAELAAGVIHTNSIGNQGEDLLNYPVPFNVSAPGCCPSPWHTPGTEWGGRSSVIACGGIHLADDSLYAPSGIGPSAWEDLDLYADDYPFPLSPQWWDYPYGGWAGGLPGLQKPDITAFTDTVMTTTPAAGLTFYAEFTGTSAATPQVAGVLAVLRQVQPEALPRHLQAALEATAVDLGPPGKDAAFGAGRPLAYDAARRLVVLARADTLEATLGGTVTIDVFGEPAAWVVGCASPFLEWPSRDAFVLADPFLVLGTWRLDGAGHASFLVEVPWNPFLLGLTAHMQFGAKAVDTAAWGRGLLLSVPESVQIVYQP